MKRLCLLLIALLLLAACGDAEAEQSKVADNQTTEETEAKEETDKETEAKEETDKETEEVVEEEEVSILTSENLNEVIEYNGTGEGDELVSAVLEGGEVKAEIKLAASDLLPSDQMAISRYSQVSDELLYYEGWETLTIEYSEVGTISMNRSEAVTDEWDMTYFPSEVIESNLN